MFEAQEISIIPNYTLETWSVKVWNYSDPFAIQFRYVNPTNNEEEYNRVTSKEKWSSLSASQFQYPFDWAAGYFGSQTTMFNLDY